ncbi:hypothetical protein [Allofournierella sp.]|uniref:hypothetical protein n=1 Tax=Allofournierella sp. TaxID=1940256 RepID=UPI003AB6DC5F
MKAKCRWLAAAYAAALAVWLLLGCAYLARGAWYEAKGLRPHTQLAWQELESSSVRLWESEEAGVWYVSTDTDPQLIWRQEAYLETVVLRVLRTTPGHAPVLYWKAPGQADFSEGRSVYAVETAPGEFTFRLGGRRVSEMRLDPDSVGGVVTRFDGVELNPPEGWYWAFVPGWGGLLLFLALPPLALALAAEARALLPGKKRTR